MNTALGALSLAATGVLVVAENLKHDVTRAVSKTVASAAFVALAVAGGAWGRGPVGQALVVALVLSMAGDLFLLSREKRWFLAGLGAFLLGHLGYAAAFLLQGVAWPVAAIAAVPAALEAWLVWRWLAPKAGSLARPVQAYILVISAMATLSIASAYHEPSTTRLGLAVAAGLFYLSDLCVARDRFVAPGPINRTVGLPLYYVAQVMFASLATSV